jgi:hypothetical protein
MSQTPLSHTALPELEQYLSQATPGLALLRYRSWQAFDALAQALQSRPSLPERTFHRLTYQPLPECPGDLVEQGRALAGPEIPILLLCPAPTAENPDRHAQAIFWKQMNAYREALGDLSAQIVIAIDETHTAACFHHAKDLVSWCSPKFVLATLALPQALAEPLSASMERSAAHHAGPPSTTLTWDTLYPLLQAALAPAQPLRASAVTGLLLPLMRQALEFGAVSKALLLVPIGDEAHFGHDRDRSHWHHLRGDLAALQGDLPEAAAQFQAALVIRQRLADSDPQNAQWQRDLFVSHWKLLHHAQAMEDPAFMAKHFQQAYGVLQRMVAAGMPLDSPVAAAYEKMKKEAEAEDGALITADR